MDDFLGKYMWPKLMLDERETQTEQLQRRKWKKNAIPLEKGKAYNCESFKPWEKMSKLHVHCSGMEKRMASILFLQNYHNIETHS